MPRARTAPSKKLPRQKKASATHAQEEVKVPPVKKTPARIKATIPMIQNDVDTVALQLEKMTERQVGQTKKTMSAIQCFVYGGAVCLFGALVLGLFLGFIVLPPLFNQEAGQTPQSGATQQAPTAVQPSAQQAAPQQQQFGFYGTLLSKEKDVMIVKELQSPLPLEKTQAQNPKTYVVRVAPETEYTHQKPRAETDSSSPLFTPENGSLDDIKIGMFIFVSTLDDTNTTETVKAAHVLYSEKSPFGQ